MGPAFGAKHAVKVTGNLVASLILDSTALTRKLPCRGPLDAFIFGSSTNRVFFYRDDSDVLTVGFHPV